MGLNRSGKALIATVLFRLLFGGYLVAQDYYAYDDTGSALTVLGIYLLLGVFTTMFLFENRFGLAGILWLSLFLIVLHTAFIIFSLGQIDGGAHAPANNWWATWLRYPLFLLTLIFVIKVYREKGLSVGIRR
jgi:hypothetical protein